MSNQRGRQIAHAMRSAALRALARRYEEGGIEELEAAWLELIETEGVGEFMKALARFMPRDLSDDDTGRRLLVIGHVPEDVDEWAKRVGIDEPIDVDPDTGDVLDDDEG